MWSCEDRTKGGNYENRDACMIALSRAQIGVKVLQVVSLCTVGAGETNTGKYQSLQSVQGATTITGWLAQLSFGL